MNTRKRFIAYAAVLLLGALVALLLLRDNPPDNPGLNRSSTSASLVGYTNAANGMLSCSYASTNGTSGRFAILRIKNSTQEALRYYSATLYLHPTNKIDSESESIRMLGFPQFEVRSGRDVLVAVPEPKTEWAVLFILVPAHNFRNWPRPLRSLLQRLGVETRERAYGAYYPE